MRNAASLAAAFVLATVHARGQAAAPPGPPEPTGAPPPAAEVAKESGWSFSASVYTYVVRDERDFAQPTITTDHGSLHLEARYNYEALETASAWIGYNFSGGESVQWELTPMLGGVFGNTRGIAPGWKASLGWWKLEVYNESEYVFDTEASSGSFFYAWSELSLAPVDWARLGVAGQRTRLYRTDRDIQRGVLGGLRYKWLDLTSYVFDPDTSTPTVVVAVSAKF